MQKNVFGISIFLFFLPNIIRNFKFNKKYNFEALANFFRVWKNIFGIKIELPVLNWIACEH